MTSRIITMLLGTLLMNACGSDAEPKEHTDTTPKSGCGNARIDTGEICDRTALASQSCQTLVNTTGTLKCLADCSAYDVSACEAPTSCGNGALDVGEVCDGLLVGTATCEALGFVGGTLTCAANCLSRDTSGCTPATCTPNCTERTCGPDPVCGISCGSCATGTCNTLGECISDCTPDCSGRSCGADPLCGLSCGSCDAGVCNAAGACVAECTPDCGGRVCGPDPECATSCGSCNTGSCDAAGQCSVVTTAGIDVRIKWSTNNTDLDLHMRKESGDYCTAADCYYGEKVPDWDQSGGASAGDPQLVIDDVTGFGPELLLYQTPANGDYHVAVHYYSDNSTDPLTTASVSIKLNGVAAYSQSRALNHGELWNVARITWSDGSGTVAAVNTITSNWRCTDSGSLDCVFDSDCPDAAWPDTQYCDTSLFFGTCKNGCRQSSNCPTSQLCTFDHTCLPEAEVAQWRDSCNNDSHCELGLSCEGQVSTTCIERCSGAPKSCAGGACCPLSQALQCIAYDDASGVCTNE